MSALPDKTAAMPNSAGWAAGTLVNGGGTAPLVLICEHAANAIPPGYGTLGCQPADLERHIAVDIGAAALTRSLARELQAPAVLCTTSRLFVDCNRAPFDADWIASSSDGCSVPANANLSSEEKVRRATLVFEPFHALVAEIIGDKRRAGQQPLIVAVHSFAPEMNGVRRPEAAIIWDKADPAQSVIDRLRRIGHEVGDNTPYDGRVQRGYTFLRHAEPFRLRRFAIEVRQDLLTTATGIELWVSRLTRAFLPALQPS